MVLTREFTCTHTWTCHSLSKVRVNNKGKDTRKVGFIPYVKQIIHSAVCILLVKTCACELQRQIIWGGLVPVITRTTAVRAQTHFVLCW